MDDHIVRWSRAQARMHNVRHELANLDAQIGPLRRLLAVALGLASAPAVAFAALFLIGMVRPLYAAAFSGQSAAPQATLSAPQTAPEQ